MKGDACGVLVLDKPGGVTSHDAVLRVRRALRTREVGHAGTLDPMATGVLVLAVGEATKLVPWLTAHDKEYEASVALGVETDSLDADGVETGRAPLGAELLAALGATEACDTSRAEFLGSSRGSPLEREAAHVAPALAAALAAELARTEQVPPAFSAIHQNGERAHARARRGEAVELAPRPVRVQRLELLACSPEPPRVALRVTADKGYYVRSLARDFARALGTLGHLVALRRLRSGCFVLGEAVPLDTPAEELAARLVPLEQAAARALPVAHLTDDGARDARHGRLVEPADLDAPAQAPSAWLDSGGRLVAVGERTPGGKGRVLRGFLP
jgi:tRNA pseudouridine55 synthase